MVADLYEAGVKNIPTEAEIGSKKSISGKMKVGVAEIEVVSDGSGAQYRKEGVSGEYNSLTDLYKAWFAKDTQDDEEAEVDMSGVDYQQWRVRTGLSIEPVFEVNGQEADIKTNEALRAAIQNYKFN